MSDDIGFVVLTRKGRKAKRRQTATFFAARRPCGLAAAGGPPFFGEPLLRISRRFFVFPTVFFSSTDRHTCFNPSPSPLNPYLPPPIGRMQVGQN